MSMVLLWVQETFRALCDDAVSRVMGRLVSNSPKGIGLTSMLYKNALRSLNLKELPADIVCAVSPAQNNPLGFLDNERKTSRSLNIRDTTVRNTPNMDLRSVSMSRLSCVSST